jgi:glycosidase
LGELWDGNPRLVSFFQGGRRQFDQVDTGVDTLFDFPKHYAMRDVFIRNASTVRLAETLAADTNYVDASVLVTFLGLHDTSRFMGEPGATIEGLKLAFTYLLTSRGTPLIYYGDEIAMRGGGDPDNRRDFPGGWPDDARDAFTKKGRTPEEQSVHAQVRRLLQLRRELPALRQGSQQFLVADQEFAAYTRTTSNSAALVLLNKGRTPARVSLDLRQTPWNKARELRDRLGILGKVRLVQGQLQAELPAKSAAILTR